MSIKTLKRIMAQEEKAVQQMLDINDRITKDRRSSLAQAVKNLMWKFCNKEKLN